MWKFLDPNFLFTSPKNDRVALDANFAFLFFRLSFSARTWSSSSRLRLRAASSILQQRKFSSKSQFFVWNLSAEYYIPSFTATFC